MKPHKSLLIDLIILAAVLALYCLPNAAAGNDKSSAAQPDKNPPRLVLESGGHQAVIRALLFTADGRELVSVGDDKTIRVWAVSPDGRNAHLSRTIRGQIEDGRGGQLAAAALSPPDSGGRQKWLAVGGYLAGPAQDRNAIRLHDFASAKVEVLLKGHTDNVLALAFSPSGRWLASAGKDRTVRLWDVSTLAEHSVAAKQALVLSGHRDRITGLAWSASGDRLASASYDGTVGLWNTAQLDNRKVISVAHLKGHTDKVRSVAFHPDGAVLISGGQDRQLRIWQAGDGKSLGVLADAQHKISAISFSPDGRLIAAGNFTPPKTEHLTLFSYPQGKVHLLFRGHDNLVLAAAFHPGGRWLATAGGDQKEILLWSAGSGEILSRLEGKGQSIYAVAFSKQGRFISWGQTSDYASNNFRGPLEHRFDLDRLERLAGGLADSDELRARENVGKYSLEVESGKPRNDDYRLNVYAAGRRVIGIDKGEADGYRHSAYTFTPDGRGILSGGQNGELWLYGLDAKARGRLVGHTGEIKAVAVSSDGRWALSGANDQTLKLWNLTQIPTDSGTGVVIAPTLTLFPTTDGQWIAWTPEGFFAASDRGSRLIGYSLNQGAENVAEYISVEQLYDRFYRPDLVYTRLHGDPGKYWEQKEASTDVEGVIAGGLAPKVTIIEPAGSLVIEENSVDVHANVLDQGGGIGKVVWRINDTTAATEVYEEKFGSRLVTSGDPVEAGMISLKQRFKLLPGNNTVELVAYNKHNEIASSAALVTFTFRPSFEPPVKAAPEKTAAGPAAPTEKPSSETAVAAPHEKPPAQEIVAETLPPQPPGTSSPIETASVDPSAYGEPSFTYTNGTVPGSPMLHLMVVGIDSYRDKALQLKYAVQDGLAIVDTIRRAGTPLFKEVKVMSLFDERVTINGMQQAFKEISGTIRPQDVFILYLAGHGITLDGRYYFLPQDFRYYNDEAVRKSAINQDHLQDWLAGVPARKSLVLIDTCESGSFSKSMVAMRGMAEKAAIAKLTRATGRATIVASTDEQPAAEGYQGHGVFTYVLLQGLRHADAHYGNRDGYTGLMELAAYINDQVPIITMNAFNFEQIPQVHMVGTDFPIGVVAATDS